VSDLWATARVDLGLTDAEFWRMTPREFDWLCGRFIERTEQGFDADLTLMAVQTAHLANMLAPRKDKRAWMTSDFLPEKRNRKRTQAGSHEPGSRPRQSPEHMKSLLMGLTHALGGTVKDRREEEATD